MHLGVKCLGSMRASRSAAAQWTADKRGEQHCLPLAVLEKRKQMWHRSTISQSLNLWKSLIHVLFSPNTVFSCNWRSPHGTELGGTPVHIHRCRWVGDAVNSPVDE